MAFFGRPRSKRLSPVRLRRTEARILESRRSDRDSPETECLIAFGGAACGLGSQRSLERLDPALIFTSPPFVGKTLSGRNPAVLVALSGLRVF